jgi:hypothetical protein
MISKHVWRDVMNSMLFSYIQSRYIPQQRRLGLLCGLLLAVLAAGCVRMEPTPHPTWSPPEEYITAKEAYARILPAAKEWDDEFVVTDISVAWHRLPEIRARPDGTAPRWKFQLHSPTKWTEFHYTSDGTIYNACFELKPASRCDRDEPVSIEELRQNAIPMDEIIDSDKAAVIVQGPGTPTVAQLYALGGRETTFAHDVQQLAWHFLFQASDGTHKSVFVNMLTGEVMHNEFGDGTPSPTSSTKP